MTNPAIHTSAIDHVVIYVRDVGRSVAFYTDILGMTVRSRGERYAFLFCGGSGQQIGLFAADEKGPPANADLNHLAFAVDAGDYGSLKRALEARGIKVRGRSGDPNCIYFDDPDKHTLQVVVPDRG